MLEVIATVPRDLSLRVLKDFQTEGLGTADMDAAEEYTQWFHEAVAGFGIQIDHEDLCGPRGGSVPGSRGVGNRDIHIHSRMTLSVALFDAAAPNLSTVFFEGLPDPAHHKIYGADSEGAIADRGRLDVMDVCEWRDGELEVRIPLLQSAVTLHQAQSGQLVASYLPHSCPPPYEGGYTRVIQTLF